MSKIPVAEFRCEECKETLEAADLRYVHGHWVCEECYYSELATRGVTAFKNDPSFTTFTKLSDVIEVKYKEGILVYYCEYCKKKYKRMSERMICMHKIVRIPSFEADELIKKEGN